MFLGEMDAFTHFSHPTIRFQCFSTEAQARECVARYTECLRPLDVYKYGRHDSFPKYLDASWWPAAVPVISPAPDMLADET